MIDKTDKDAIIEHLTSTLRKVLKMSLVDVDIDFDDMNHIQKSFDNICDVIDHALIDVTF